MRIKHLTLMSGPTGNFEIGHERDVSDKEGAALIAGGYAIEVRRRAPEAATARPGETAEQTAAQHLAAIKAAGRGGKKKIAPPAGEQDGAGEPAPVEPAAE